MNMSDSLSDKLAQMEIFVEEALYNDECHHKQWYIERIYELLFDTTVEEIKARFQKEGEDLWEKGIAP